MTPAAYTQRDPSTTVLYQVVADHLETFLATIDDDPTAKGLPQFVKDEFYAYLQCGILAHGFLRRAVTAASTRCGWPSVVSGAAFVRHVPAGAWRRRRRIWSSR